MKMWFVWTAGVKANTFAIEGFSVGQCKSVIMKQAASPTLYLSSVTNYQAGMRISCSTFCVVVCICVQSAKPIRLWKSLYVFDVASACSFFLQFRLFVQHGEYDLSSAAKKCAASTFCTHITLSTGRGTHRK